MLYMILGTENENSLPLRLKNRPAHVARLQSLQNEGRLVIAGPLPAIDSPNSGQAGFQGSLIIAEFGSLLEAEAWAAADPYTTQGVFASVRVAPFTKTMPT